MKPDRSASTRFAILGLLSVEPMSGYDIRRASAQWLHYFWHESYGQIYPTLGALAREGLIRLAPPALPAAGRAKSARPRKVYAITPAGRRTLAAWRRTPPVSRPIRDGMLLRLFFGDRPSVPALLAHIGRLRARETRHLAEFKVIARRIRGEAKDHPARPFWHATLRFGMLRSNAIVHWCDETARALHALGPKRPRRRSARPRRTP